jgi:simple sugar transport system permease protein
MKNWQRYIPALIDNMIWLLLLVTLLFFAVLSNRFITTTNLTNILTHASVLGILVVGQSFVLITGNFDLSIESTVGFTALIGAWLVAQAGAPSYGSGLMLNPVMAIMVMFLVAVLIGWLNGILITRLKVNNFIATLSMLIILRGLILAITSGNTITRLPPVFTYLGRGVIGGVLPVPVLVMVLTFILAHLVMKYTPFGRELYAVGGNRDAALASGINPDRRIRQAYLVSACFGALAGLVLVGRLSAFPANLGQNMNFDMFAAAVVGGISLNGGRGFMLGAFGGVLLLSSINSGLNMLRVNSFWIDTIRGLIILAAMFIDAQKLRYKGPQQIATVRAKEMVEPGKAHAS